MAWHLYRFFPLSVWVLLRIRSLSLIDRFPVLSERHLLAAPERISQCVGDLGGLDRIVDRDRDRCRKETKCQLGKRTNLYHWRGKPLTRIVQATPDKLVHLGDKGFSEALIVRRTN